MIDSGASLDGILRELAALVTAHYDPSGKLNQDDIAIV
jgi:hypothetical protein